MKQEIKPSFNKEYANKVDKLIFVEEFESVYPGVDLNQAWEDLQEEKPEKKKGK